MSGFADVYQRLCERYPNEQDRGRAFEPLVARVLRTDPLYKARFAEVWRWSEWPGRDGGDIGIDIVAKRHDGRLAAIQCKCQDRIDKHHIDSFLSESQRRLMGDPTLSGTSSPQLRNGATTRSEPSAALTRLCSVSISSA